jgi:hypothetical protein
MERRPPHGAPITTPVSMSAISIRFANAWLRFQGMADIARRIYSRI